MLWFYRVLFIPALLVLAPRYLWRMRKRGGYAENFGQRFGAHPKLPPRVPGRPRVWLQAVSVGEMLAIQPILEGLHRDGAEVYLTTTTSTGHRLARERYLNLVAGLGYFPIDAWPFSARAWRRIDPDVVVLTEGERWPEHLHQAQRRRVPVICLNARLSDRSFARMKALGSLARLMTAGITQLLPASRQDEYRFLELGVSRSRLGPVGNIKLDVQIPRLDTAARSQLRRELGLRDEDLLLLGSSTWPGEEEALVEVLRRARAGGVRCSLLIVPRHAERRADVESLLAGSGWRTHFRSRGAAPGVVDIAVADTTGELRRLTQLADLVFVGKSLPPHTEGQTPVEAAALEKPLVFGRGMGNFRVIAEELVSQRGARQVSNGEELAATCLGLLRHPEERRQLAAAASAWQRENAGAVARSLVALREEFTRLPR